MIIEIAARLGNWESVNETAVRARKLGVSQFCSMPQASKKFGYDARGYGAREQ